MSKTAGIIGGLGPDTTAKFYLEVISLCLKESNVRRPPILIWNVPVPLKVEDDLLIKSRGEERFLPLLITAAKNLERGGADFLVMPCNSLHIFMDEIRISVHIPTLSIIEEATKFLQRQRVNSVGLLATSTTVNKELFTKPLRAAGIAQVIPNKVSQRAIDRVIHNLVLNTATKDDKNIVINILNKFNEVEVQNVLLACTDLQLLNLHHPRLRIFDTMKILAHATANVIMTPSPCLPH